MIPARNSKLMVPNGSSITKAEIPLVSVEEFRDWVCRSVTGGGRISAFFGIPNALGKVRLYAIIALDHDGMLTFSSAEVSNSYEAITPDCTQAHLFEREISEQCGIHVNNHPWMKPVRFEGDMGAPVLENPFRVEGEEVHEVAVGPVHAGIIEPGHFRFQCHGEVVFNLEISLGYQHRGIEKAMLRGPGPRTVHYAETVAGDTTIGHATAYCEVLEALGGTMLPARAQALRGIALELERIANHTGDLGALAGDIGYLPTASYCGRIRGDFLNMSALMCGSRFGRGLVRLGGVSFDCDAERLGELKRRLDAAEIDVTRAVELLWDTPSVLARFENTGRVSREVALEIGLVGVAARASGVERDVRFDHATGLYQFAQIPVSTWDSGDVFARAYVRWLEVQRSIVFIREQIENMPGGPIRSDVEELPPDTMAVSLVEGWRGEICHVGMTNSSGKFEFYKIVDPSFHNWTGLSMALRDQQISDFPLCNKSFNLSYCGHDL